MNLLPQGVLTQEWKATCEGSTAMATELNEIKGPFRSAVGWVLHFKRHWLLSAVPSGKMGARVSLVS